VTPSSLAEQMTLLDLRMFRSILPKDVIHYVRKEKRSSAVIRLGEMTHFFQIFFFISKKVMIFFFFFRGLISSFNNLSKWITSSLDRERNPSTQIEMLKFHLNLLKELLQFGNLQSAKSVQTGIRNSQLLNEGNPSFSDLRKTFHRCEISLEKKCLKFNSGSHSKITSCIPWIGTFLDDLQEINTSHDNHVCVFVKNSFFFSLFS